MIAAMNWAALATHSLGAVAGIFAYYERERRTCTIRGKHWRTSMLRGVTAGRNGWRYAFVSGVPPRVKRFRWTR